MIEQNYTPPAAWQEKAVTALTNPISEFNARAGMGEVSPNGELDITAYISLRNQLLSRQNRDIVDAKFEEIKASFPVIDTYQDPLSGQHFRAQRFNWSEDGTQGQTVTAYFMGYSCPINWDHIQYEHSQIASALGTPFIVFENAGHGKSDKLSPDQKKALKDRGDFGPIAEAYLRILQKLNVTDINSAGYSIGAEIAAAVAAHARDYEIDVSKLLVFEDPGVNAQASISLVKNFLSGGKDQRFTWQNPIDPVLASRAKIKPYLPRGTAPFVAGMVRGNLENYADTAFQTQPNMKFILASAGSSTISNPAANNQLFTRLQQRHQTRQLRRIIIPGETHSFGDSGEPYAWLVKLALR